MSDETSLAGYSSGVKGVAKVAFILATEPVHNISMVLKEGLVFHPMF